jgi:hypothetical protein
VSVQLFGKFGPKRLVERGSCEGGARQGQVDPADPEDKQEEGRDGGASEVEDGAIVQKQETSAHPPHPVPLPQKKQK